MRTNFGSWDSIINCCLDKAAVQSLPSSNLPLPPGWLAPSVYFLEKKNWGGRFSKIRIPVQCYYSRKVAARREGGEASEPGASWTAQAVQAPVYACARGQFRCGAEFNPKAQKEKADSRHAQLGSIH